MKTGLKITVGAAVVAMVFVFCGGEGTPEYCSDGYPQNQYTEFCYGGETYPLCGGDEFIPPAQFCDDNKVYDRCGGDGGAVYSPTTQFCFDGNDTVYTKCGGATYNPTTQGCVNNVILTSCGTGFYDASIAFCEDNRIHQKCGGLEYVYATHFCSDDNVFEKCGGHTFTPATHYCFNDEVTEKCPGGNYNDDGSCIVNGVAEYSVRVSSRGDGVEGSGTYREGSTVTIVAGTAPVGEEFKNWNWSSVRAEIISANEDSSTITFIMPNDNVFVNAIFEPIPIQTYTVTIISDGADASGGGDEYRAGDIVRIFAGTAPADHFFYNWTTASDSVTFGNERTDSTSFVMPANDVTVTANFWAKRGTFIDERDDQEYKYVIIGTQIWMAENLNYDTLSDTSSWCYPYRSFPGFPATCFYTWDIALEVCPDGWHLPSNDEWQILINAVGSNVGTKLKSNTLWRAASNETPLGTDEFGFSALPAGYRDNSVPNPTHSGLREYGYWWTATESENNNYHGIYRLMQYDSQEAGWMGRGKFDGLSVRCIMND